MRGDYIEIQNIKSLYCELSDLCATNSAKAALGLREILTEDVHGEYTQMGNFDGRDALVNYMTTSMVANLAWSWHAIQSPYIEIMGDIAQGRWTLLLKLKLKTAPGELLTFAGRYTDKFQRTPTGWKLSSIKWTAEV